MIELVMGDLNVIFLFWTGPHLIALPHSSSCVINSWGQDWLVLVKVEYFGEFFIDFGIIS